VGARNLAWVDTTCESEYKGAFKNQRRKGFEDMITVLVSSLPCASSHYQLAMFMYRPTPRSFVRFPAQT
jgi:hypothetical protein